MKYMLMMHAPKEGWTTAGIGTWKPEEIRAHIEFMLGLNEKLKASGEFVDGQGLAGPEEAKSVRARKDGTPDTHAPFARAKGRWPRRRSSSRASGSSTSTARSAHTKSPRRFPRRRARVAHRFTCRSK